MKSCLHCKQTPASLYEAGSPHNVYCSHLCQALAYIGVKRPRENEIEELFEAMNALKMQKTFDMSRAAEDIQKQLEEYLVQAVKNGWVGAVQDLIFKRGMSPNTTGGRNGLSLLEFAIFSNQKEVVKVLLNHSLTDPNQRNNYNNPAFFAIAYDEKTNMVIAEMVLKDKRIDISMVDNLGRTILHVVSDYARQDNGEDLIEFLFKNTSINVNVQDKEGDTALHNAVYSSKTTSTDRSVSLLLNHPDIDPNLATLQKHNTPLHYAAWSTESTLKTLEMLLRHPRTNLYLKDSRGQTAYDVTRTRTQRLLFRAYSLSKNLQIPYDQSKFIAARELQRKICTYLDDTPSQDLMELARILNIPQDMTNGKTKDELCIIISDVIAAGGIWDMERYQETQALRRQAMTSFARGALLKPLDKVKEEIRQYFGISTLDQMSAAQLWTIVEKFRTL